MSYAGVEAYPDDTCWWDGGDLEWNYGRRVCKRCGKVQYVAKSTPTQPPLEGKSSAKES
jgi:hypothetical protein